MQFRNYLVKCVCPFLKCAFCASWSVVCIFQNDQQKQLLPTWCRVFENMLCTSGLFKSYIKMSCIASVWLIVTWVDEAASKYIRLSLMEEKCEVQIFFGKGVGADRRGK